MSQTRVSDLATNAPDHEILRDFVVGGLSLGAAILGAMSHFGQGGRLHADYGAEPGPALLPELLLAALALAGALLVLRGLLSRRARMKPARTMVAASEAEDDPAVLQPWRAVAALGITIAFALLQPVIGFGAAACILCAGLSVGLGWGEGRSWPRSTAEGLVVAAMLYAIFRYVLSVPLT